MSEGLSVVEFASRVGLSKGAVYRLVREGRLESYKPREVGNKAMRIITDPDKFKRELKEFEVSGGDTVISTIATIVQKDGKIKIIRASSVIGLIKKLKKL